MTYDNSRSEIMKGGGERQQYGIQIEAYRMDNHQN